MDYTNLNNTCSPRKKRNEGSGSDLAIRNQVEEKGGISVGE